MTPDHFGVTSHPPDRRPVPLVESIKPEALEQIPVPEATEATGPRSMN